MNCPKSEKCVPVSRQTRPVTVVAEFDVKYASRKLVKVPLEDDMGRDNNNAPAKMTAKNEIIITKEGLNLNIL